MAKETNTNTITIDGQSYDVKSLSKAARTSLVNLKLTDDEIKRLKVQLGIAQTARATFASRIKAELPAGKKTN